MRGKRAGKIVKLNCRERRERKIFGKFCTSPPPPPNLASYGQIIYFLSRRGHIIYFQHFQGQNIYSQKVPAPPPSESNGRPLMTFPIMYYAVCQ